MLNYRALNDFLFDIAFSRLSVSEDDQKNRAEPAGSGKTNRIGRALSDFFTGEFLNCVFEFVFITVEPALLTAISG